MKHFTDNTSTIPVLSAENKNGKKNKNMEYAFIAIAVILVIAIVITIAVIKSKKSDTNDAKGFVTEESGDFIVANKPEPESETETIKNKETDISPVTFSEDVFVSFEGISTELAESLTEHTILSAVTTAIKPDASSTQKATTTAATTKNEKPTKPQITTTEYLEKTTVVTTQPTTSDETALTNISSFFSGIYYFDGEMIAGEEKTPLELAINGSNFHLFSEMDGKDIAIMSLDGKLYLLNPDTKKYMELTASVQKMMGIDASQFAFEFNKTKFDANKPFSVTKAQYNGQDAVCYTYKDEKTCIEFISVNEEIKQMVFFDSDGTASTILTADEFSSEIPDEMLTFKGYSKTNIISFMSSLI